MAGSHIEATRDWVLKAHQDMESALYLGGRDDLRTTAVYHCQQAAEKVVKAFLVFHSLPVPKTHDIADLLDDALTVEPAFAALDADAILLNPLATKFRYPSNAWDNEPTEDELTEALAAARRIYEFVLSVLPVETHPSS
jgi:HEPN domain-containing protein